MSTTGDAGRRARRALARRLHPDLGGDAEAFARAMARLDAPAPPPVARRRWRTAARRWRRELPTRLPRRWPGARRYGHL